MLWVGHSALLRSTELLHLRWSDVSFERHGVRVRLRPEYDKTALGGAPQFVWIPAKGSEAKEALLAWRSARNTAVSPAALIWAVPSYKVWLSTLKYVGRCLGLDGVSTHSLRAGGTTDLLEGGAPHEIVKRLGRWRSDCFLQYWRPHPEELTAHLAAAFSASLSRTRWWHSPDPLSTVKPCRPGNAPRAARKQRRVG